MNSIEKGLRHAGIIGEDKEVTKENLANYSKWVQLNKMNWTDAYLYKVDYGIGIKGDTGYGN